MEITGVELFDLYGDGTLVIKTNVDQEDETLRYAWYISESKELIYKGKYQNKPFTAIQLKHLGSYTVKAFVMDGNGNKAEFLTKFAANKRTSPKLPHPIPQVTPSVTHISGAFWQFSVDANLEKNARIAWYVYQEGQPNPIAKLPYASDKEAIYQFEKPGNYAVKVFIVQHGEKKSFLGSLFTVTL